jgi:hypothetical protein
MQLGGMHYLLHEFSFDEDYPQRVKERKHMGSKEWKQRPYKVYMRN